MRGARRRRSASPTAGRSPPASPPRSCPGSSGSTTRASGCAWRPKGGYALEQILDGLPADVFVADDALGWVYQFWQKDKKDEVNASERKIGGADLGPVTQLFTENYMVRFLLENSLGAWWATRHPDSPLRGFEYLRVDDDGKPAAGSFDGWPDRVAEVTVMDPCCGSGHFLVEAFSMLWQMRPRRKASRRSTPRTPCSATTCSALSSTRGACRSRCSRWHSGLEGGGGWRELPVPNVACSGIPVKAPAEEWKDLADGNRLELLSSDCTSCSGTPTRLAA